MKARHVLLVEDDERSAELIRVTLGATGLELERVRSLGEARRSLASRLPDAILLDLRLPDGPGYLLAQEVRSTPDGDDIYILAVSASVGVGDRSMAIEHGCDDFLEKPISPRDLVMRLKRWEEHGR